MPVAIGASANRVGGSDAAAVLSVDRIFMQFAGFTAGEHQSYFDPTMREIHRVLDQLVEQLNHEIGRAARKAGIFGRLQRQMRAGKAVAISGHGRD